MYLLEPKEIQENIRGLSSTMDAIEACNKAQLRKVVKWLRVRWRSYEGDAVKGTSRMTFVISEEEWQQMRKEALGE